MSSHIVKVSYRWDFQRGSHEEHVEVCAELVVKEYDTIERQLLAVQNWVNSISEPRIAEEEPTL